MECTEGYPDGRTEIPYSQSVTRNQNMPDYSDRYQPSSTAEGYQSMPSPYAQESSMTGYTPNMYSPGSSVYPPTSSAYPPGTSYTMAPGMGTMPAPQDPRYPNYTYDPSQRPGEYVPQGYQFSQNPYAEMSRSSRPDAIPPHYSTTSTNASRMADPSRSGYYEDSPMGGMPSAPPGGYPPHRAPGQSQYDSLARDSRQQPSESSFPRTGRR